MVELKNPDKNSLKNFLRDFEVLNALPVSKKYSKLCLAEYPFDLQLLNLSPLYRASRKYYLSLGGVFTPRICSTMRSLSTHDLFKNDIDYTPAMTEMLWFKKHSHVLADPEIELSAILQFHDISLYHEQNHRVIWKLLPPAPLEQHEIRRYLNFAESLVVTLDVALGDEVGNKLSPVFESMRILYRPAGRDNRSSRSKTEYRQYLLAILCATYYALEGMETADVLKAVNYVLPGQAAINRAAANRSLELNEHFIYVTNPQWQLMYWKSAGQKLKKIHKGSKLEVFYIPEDPLDLSEEFFHARRIFDYYGL